MPNKRLQSFAVTRRTSGVWKSTSRRRSRASTHKERAPATVETEEQSNSDSLQYQQLRRTSRGVPYEPGLPGLRKLLMQADNNMPIGYNEEMPVKSQAIDEQAQTSNTQQYTGVDELVNFVEERVGASLEDIFLVTLQSDERGLPLADMFEWISLCVNSAVSDIILVNKDELNRVRERLKWVYRKEYETRIRTISRRIDDLEARNHELERRLSRARGSEVASGIESVDSRKMFYAEDKSPPRRLEASKKGPRPTRVIKPETQHIRRRGIFQGTGTGVKKLERASADFDSGRGNLHTPNIPEVFGTVVNQDQNGDIYEYDVEKMKGVCI